MAIDSYRYKNPFDITTAGFSDNGELLVQGDFSYPNKSTKPNSQNNQSEQGIQSVQGVQDAQETDEIQGVQGIQGIQETQEDSVIRVASILEAKNIANENPSAEFVIENRIAFMFRSGRFMFVKDDSGVLLIYDYITPKITTQYNEGDVFDEIQGKLMLYQGTWEFIPSKNTPYQMYAPVKIEPISVTINDIKNDYAHYESQLVTLNDVIIDGDTMTISQNENTIKLYNRFNSISMEIPNGTHANITGFAYFSTNYGYQIWPRSNNDIEIIQ